jgi:hypothetical protein
MQRWAVCKVKGSRYFDQVSGIRAETDTNGSRTGSAARWSRGTCLVDALAIHLNTAVPPCVGTKRLACAGGPELLESLRRKVIPRHICFRLSLKARHVGENETGWCQISEAHPFIQVIFPFLDVRGSR